MSMIIDIAWDRPSISDLLANGVTAVCRYLSYDTTGKNLTRAEAHTYADAGIQIVSNWEYARGAALQGHAQGDKDARNGLSEHADCGGPSNKPIYYSVDVNLIDYRPDLPNDTDPTNNLLKLGPVAGYFQAINDVHAGQPVGAYAGVWGIRRLFNAGLIAYGWQTYAWSGSPTVWEPRAQLRQVDNGISLAGHNVDRDTNIAPDFGAWFPWGHVPSPAPTPTPPVPGTHKPGSRMCLLTNPFMAGEDVGFIQRFIGPARCGVADGVFGPHTRSGVIWYQGMRGISADGVVGPVTWRNMGVPWIG